MTNKTVNPRQEAFNKEVARLAELALTGIRPYRVEFYTLSDGRSSEVIETTSAEEAEKIVSANWSKYNCAQVIDAREVRWGVLHGWEAWVDK